jgi:hypothetical protein
MSIPKKYRASTKIFLFNSIIICLPFEYFVAVNYYDANDPEAEHKKGKNIAKY